MTTPEGKIAKTWLGSGNQSIVGAALWSTVRASSSSSSREVKGQQRKRLQSLVSGGQSLEAGSELEEAREMKSSISAKVLLSGLVARKPYSEASPCKGVTVQPTVGTPTCPSLADQKVHPGGPSARLEINPLIAGWWEIMSSLLGGHVMGKRGEGH